MRREILTGEALSDFRDLLWCTRGNDAAATGAAVGAEIEDPVGGLDDLEIVLDHQHRVAGLDQPVRFDFFGDSLESIRTFDAETQRTLLDMRALDLVPVSEFQLVTETIRRFRMGYVATFGAPQRDDLLYEAVSEGRRHPGMEHWLPLFQERMDTLFDYLDGAPVAIEPQGEDAARDSEHEGH